ncbi:MAG TPA: TraR/DksA family transcriptional regulator [Thermoanaerobaculaceae bacterium]|nr:TraR/DksA family transcriptional regulator [Thermoanaerobaculaceae bacterium]
MLRYNLPVEAVVKPTIDLEGIRRLLEARRQELVEGVSRAREMGAVEGEAGVPDIADRATNAFQREFSFSVSENEGRMLKLIEEAIKRVESGIYGQCTHCGQVIEKPRIHAIPWARYCIACQEAQDRGEL